MSQSTPFTLDLSFVILKQIIVQNVIQIISHSKHDRAEVWITAEDVPITNNFVIEVDNLAYYCSCVKLTFSLAN
jgi:hypothetical protein